MAFVVRGTKRRGRTRRHPEPPRCVPADCSREDAQICHRVIAHELELKEYGVFDDLDGLCANDPSRAGQVLREIGVANDEILRTWSNFDCGEMPIEAVFTAIDDWLLSYPGVIADP